MAPPSEYALTACHCCGLIHQRMDINEADIVARCRRCHSKFPRRRDVQLNAARTAAAAIGALLLYFPAILLPILEVERLGHRYESSIVTGIADLFHEQEWFVGSVVLLFSIILPLAKLALLLELSLLELLHQRHRLLTYRVVEVVGKWSMLDVLLLAFVVMLIKMGELVQFHFGPAVIAFTLCVVMSMIASISFDPHAIWEDAQ